MNESFYDGLAEEYDVLTATASRVGPARRFVRGLTESGEVSSALDVACGTGLYAIELARAGVETVGADLSAEMVAAARDRARREGVEVRFVPAAMQDVADRVDGPFDVVVCMGNSVPHLLTDHDLELAMAGFRRLTRDGGRTIIQLLNYERILAGRERIVGVDRRGEREFVRFYDFLDGFVRFNVLAIDLSDDEPRWDLHETTLRPYTADDLRRALREAGFVSVDLAGDLGEEPFVPAESDTVMLTARQAGSRK